MITLVLCTLVIIGSSGFVAALESAIMAVGELQLVTLRANHPERADILRVVFRKKSAHLSALVLINTLITTVGSMVVGILATQIFDELEVALFSAVLTYVMTVFAKMLPKLWGVEFAESILLRYIRWIHWSYFACWPFLQLTMIWVHILPKNRHSKRHRDDLLSILKHYSNNGVIEKRQRQQAVAVLTAHRQQLQQISGRDFPLQVVHQQDTVQHVLDTVEPCKQYGVMADDELIGLVRHRDLLLCKPEKRARKTVRSLLRKVVVLDGEASWYDGMKALHETGSAAVVLLDTDNARIKVITAKKLYRHVLD